MRRLPPLNGLRAFEAAGRHLSFTRAADELNVTPAAISQQVRQLEDFLGVSLFRRLTRALRLTEAGQAALPLLTDGFDALAAATERLTRHERAGVLTVSAAPSFAANWLVQRLGRFQRAHPDINIRIDASLELVDFDRDDVDMSVRFGLGDYPGLRSDRLMTEVLRPFCSPALLDGDKPLQRPDDLEHQTLLHTDWGRQYEHMQPDWTMWLKTAGVEGVDASRGPVFSTEILAVQAAIDGQGVALVNQGIVVRDVADKRLVPLFDLTLPTEFGFFVVCPERTADLPKNAAFRAWLLAEVAADREQERDEVA